MIRRVAPLLLLVAACYPKEGPPPAAATNDAVATAQKRWPDATEASLGEGRMLFLASCNQCHGYPDLHALDAPKLEREAREMARDKAKLDEQKTELLVRFVMTSREAK